MHTTMPGPIGWITDESIYRLERGGNDSKGTVPIHKSRSYVAKTPVLLAAQAEAYADARVCEALEAAKQLADWAEFEVGAEPELTPGLQALRALLPSTPARPESEQ